MDRFFRFFPAILLSFYIFNLIFVGPVSISDAIIILGLVFLAVSQEFFLKKKERDEFQTQIKQIVETNDKNNIEFAKKLSEYSHKIETLENFRNNLAASKMHNSMNGGIQTTNISVPRF